MNKGEEEEKVKQEGEEKGGTRIASRGFLLKASMPRVMGLRVRAPGRLPLS